MNKYEETIQSFIEQYCKLAIRYIDGLSEGNYRKTNKAYDKLVKLFNQLKQDDVIARHVLPILLKSDDFRVRMSAAAHSLGLKKHIPEAEKILEELAKSSDHEFLLRHNAEMTLKVWREKGFLDFRIVPSS